MDAEASRHPASPIIMGSQTTVEAEAPYAIEQARGALEGIDIEEDDREIEKIVVTVHRANGDHDDGGDSHTVEMKPSVMPLAGTSEIDLGRWQFPQGDPERLSPNTHLHVLAVTLCAAVEDDGYTTGYSAVDIASMDGCPLEQGQVTSAMTNMFKNKNLVMRRRTSNGYEYLVTEELHDEYERLGTYDLHALKGVE